MNQKRAIRAGIEKLYTLGFILLLLIFCDQNRMPAALADYAEERVLRSSILVPDDWEISNTRITIGTSQFTDNTAITVTDGAVLTIKDSLLDLSNIGRNTAIEVIDGGTLILDHTEVSGANGQPVNVGDGKDIYTYGGYFVVKGGTLKIINNSVFKNNANTNNYGPIYYKFAHNIIVVYDGNLDIIDSVYSENSGKYCTHIKAINSDINVENSQITNNTGAEIFNIYKSRVKFSNTDFSGNQIAENNGFPGGICANVSYIDLYENNEFKNNTRNLFLLANCKLNIESSNIFKSNDRLAEIRSAAMIQIDGAEFNSNNSGFDITASTSLRITNSKFTGNKISPVIYYEINTADSHFTDVSFELPGKLDEDITPEVNIKDSEFTNNTGGAIFIGNLRKLMQRMPGEDAETLIPVFIENTKFTGNSAVTDGYDKLIKGGAVYLGNTVHAYINNLVVSGNTASNGGGGIFVDQYGQVFLNPRKGAMIYDNELMNAEKDDIRVLDSENNNMFSEKMLNGGFYNWTETDRFTNSVKYYEWKLIDRVNIEEVCGDDEDCEVYYFCREYPKYYTCEDGWLEYYDWDVSTKDVSGYTLVSNPSLLDRPEDNIVLMEGNSAVSSEGKDAYGGGISVNGILEIGEPGVTVSVRKIWNTGNAGIPAPEAFLPMLELHANGQPFPTGEFRQQSQTTEEGKTVTVFTIENDPWVTVRVTDNGENVYEVLYEDLPAEIDGTAVEYSVSENSGNYEAQIEGNMEQGFVIVNTPKEEETEQNWFYVLENSRELPHTGFSAIRPQALPGQAVSYKASGLTLQIPALSISAEIVGVPVKDGRYAVEWLGGNAGLLEGSSRPGMGVSLIAAHNHLNTTETGPFALLSELKPGDVLFVLDLANALQPFSVYANEKISETDIEAVKNLAVLNENALILITCEDERVEGGYANRRVIAAKPQ